MSGQAVIQGLIARGVPEHIAYGIAGNMQIESDGFKTDVNEYAPFVAGSRGGYGLNQWTGPRRRQFEEFAQSRGARPSDLDTQLDFTLWELQNTEKSAGNALMQASNPTEAARIYSEKFLRPGVPHLDRRVSAANALAGSAGQPPQAAQRPQMAQAPQPGYPTPQTNALAPQPPAEQQRGPQLASNVLDPRAFMTPVQQPQYLRFV